MLSILGGPLVAFRAHVGGANTPVPPNTTTGANAASFDAAIAAGLDLFFGHVGGQLTVQQGFVTVSPVVSSTSERIVLAIGARW